MSSLNQRESSELNNKSTTESINKVLFEVTKSNPLPFIRKGIDSYINERKMKKKKKFLHIEDSEQQNKYKSIYLKQIRH